MSGTTYLTNVHWRTANDQCVYIQLDTGDILLLYLYRTIDLTSAVIDLMSIKHLVEACCSWRPLIFIINGDDTSDQTISSTHSESGLSLAFR